MNKLVSVIALIFLMGLVSIGCSGGDSVTADVEVGVEKIAYEGGEVTELIIKVSIDGKVVEFDVSDMLGDRTGAASVEFGTDMTADELRQYFAVWWVDTAFPSSNYGDWIRCYIYSQAGIRDDGDWEYVGIRGAFDMYDDATISALVMMFEFQGIDVPDGPPPDDIC